MNNPIELRASAEPCSPAVAAEVWVMTGAGLAVPGEAGDIVGVEAGG